MTVIPRMAGLATSVIRSFAEGAPAGNISLALGEPGWSLPEVAREALARWSAYDVPCSYGPNTGIGELQSALVDRYETFPDQIMVTTGSQAALFALFTAHVDPGAAVAVPDPGFPVYRTLTKLAGGTVTTYPLAADGSLDAGALIRALDRHGQDDRPPVRLVMLNHPGNPTGGGATNDALDQVARACARRGAILVSDEVYRELPSAGEHPSLRDVTDSGVVTESVSKAWVAPGLRVGWAVGPPALLAPARLVHNAMNTAPARPSQVAAAALLRATGEVVRHARQELSHRWDLVESRAPGWLLGGDRAAGGDHPDGVGRPAGGFYLWSAIPDAVADADRWVTGLRDGGGVSVVPGTAFGSAGTRHMRVSVGGPVDELVEGLARLEAYAARTLPDG